MNPLCAKGGKLSATPDCCQRSGSVQVEEKEVGLKPHLSHFRWLAARLKSYPFALLCEAWFFSSLGNQQPRQSVYFLRDGKRRRESPEFIPSHSSRPHFVN
jgi:hypothetical protein